MLVFLAAGRSSNSSPDSRSLQAGVRKEAMLEIKRRFGRAKPVVYQVIDKPPAKKSSVRP